MHHYKSRDENREFSKNRDGSESLLCAYRVGPYQLTGSRPSRCLISVGRGSLCRHFYRTSFYTTCFTKARMKHLQKIQTHINKADSVYAATLYQKLLSKGFSQQEIEAQLVSGIETLPGKYKQVLILHYFNNQSVQDIKTTVSKSESTVRNRLSYGLYLLRQQITQS